jgi:hypothetical protein
MGDFGPAALVPEAPVDHIAPLSSTDPDEISVLVTGFGVSSSSLGFDNISSITMASDWTFILISTSHSKPT